MIADLMSGEIDVGILWGPMAGFLAKKANPPLHVAPLVKETGGPATGVSYRHGGARARPELEAAAQPADPGEPACHQQDPPGLWRSVARRKRSADRRGDAQRKRHEGSARGPVPRLHFRSSRLCPRRKDHTRAGRIPDGRLPCAGSRDASAARACLPPPKPSESGKRRHRRIYRRHAARAKTANSARRARSGETSRDSTFPAACGCRTPATESWRRRRKTICGAGSSARRRATLPTLVVIYCLADCWMSWNAAKRILAYGYSNVAWYPEGTDGWERTGLAC